VLRIADTFIVENPQSVSDALKLLHRYGERARVVAGGTDILPNIKHGLHAPEVLINLKAVNELKAMDLDADPISIGALVSIHQLATDEHIVTRLPALAQAASEVAGPQLRRMGTLGGNVCLDTRCVYINQTHFWREALGFCIKKDGTACHVVETGKRCVAAASNDTAPVLIALGASIVIENPQGARTVRLEDFYLNDGVKNQRLAADDLVTQILIPRTALTRRQAFQKLRVRGAIDFPMLNMALAYDAEDGVITHMDLVFSAIAARPRRIKNLPTGRLNAELVEATAQAAFKQVRPLTNINGEVVWRREMVPVLVKRAFEQISRQT
jgi:4-hydroxybenzoyl-CoA reductase subunit beta